MDNKFGKDMTVGSVPRHLITFALPMLIINLLQTGYSIVNAIWVGNILGKDAVGAIGVSFPIVFILIAISTGVTLATTILVSQYYGAKNYDMVKKVVNNSFSIAILLGIVLTILGIMSSDYLLKIMNTPAEVFSMASSYLKITVGGFFLMYLGALIVSILRGIGDTVTPLKFFALGMIANAILDPVLIIGIGPFPKLGLNGAAYASVIAQVVGTLFALIYLNHKNHIVAVSPKSFTLDKQLSYLIFKIGLPSTVQQSLVSIGMAFITTFVNAFGTSAIAAFSAAGRLESVAFMPAMSLGMATSALTGQNIGANKHDRVHEIFKWGVITTSVITISISVILVAFPKLLLLMFVQDADVISIGSTYLRIIAPAYIFFAVMFVSNGIINGAGHTFITMVFTLLSLWLIRVPLSAYLSHTSLGITGIWIAIITSFAFTMIVSLMYYRSGKWKKAVIRNAIVEEET